MIPDNVETSISLEDRVSPSCEKIIYSLNKVLNVYDKLSEKLQKGLSINITNNIDSIINNKTLTLEKYLQRKKLKEEKLTLQIKKRFKELDYNYGTSEQQKVLNKLKSRGYNENYLHPVYISGRDKIAAGIKADYKNERNKVYYDYDDNNRNKELERIYYGINTLSSKLLSAISIENIKKAIDLSDSLSQVRTRIDLLNQSFNKRNGTDYDTDSFMDYIYKSAQNARVGYYDMANTIASLGTYSSGVFDNQKETVAFTNLLYKVLRTNGMNSEDASGGVKQVVNLINIGELKSQQLLALLKQAPSITSMVTKTLEITEKELEEMVKKGRLSARAIKDIMLINIDDINKKFEEIPMTWRDVVTQISNIILKVFEPSLNIINKFANNQEFINSLKKTVTRIGVLIRNITTFFLNLVGILTRYWNIIEPIIYGIVYLVIFELIQKVVVGFVSIFETFALLFSNPYILGIILAAAAIGSLFSNIDELGEKAKETGDKLTNTSNNLGETNEKVADTSNNLGKINEKLTMTSNNLGEINEKVTMINNIKEPEEEKITTGDLLHGVASSAGKAISLTGDVLANLVGGVFNAGVGFAKGVIEAPVGIGQLIGGGAWDLYGTIMDNRTAKEIAKKTYSTATDTLLEAGKDLILFPNAAEVWGSLNEGDKFYKKYFGDDWFAKGVYDSMQSRYEVSDENETNNPYITDINKYIEDLKKEMEKANSTLDITSEDLKYMMDIAEREAINRFTTAEIKVEMQNNNNINNNMDIDGMVDYLASGLEEAMHAAAEGVN